jgi:uncharacterized coiled-coil protein SlyX
MSEYEFNLSRYAERLELAGVTREQALVHAELTAGILQNLVTKDQLREELASLEQRLREFMAAAIAKVELRMETRFAQLETRFAQLEAKLAHVHADFLKWLFIAFFMQGSFIVACLKLLP